MPSILGIRNPQLVNNLLPDFIDRRPWVAWTPTVDQNGAVAATVTLARYITLANTVHITAELAITGAGTAANAIIVQGIPAAIAPTDVSSNRAVGIVSILDNGTAYYIGAVFPIGAADLRFRSDGNTNYIGITPNFALASGDIISFTATWEK